MAPKKDKAPAPVTPASPKKPRAPQVGVGENATDKAASKKMQDFLAYHSKAGRDAERRQEACQAMTAWKALSSPEDRLAFVRQFEQEGSGKTPGSLRFATSFSASQTSSKRTRLEAIEDFLTRTGGRG